MKIEIYRFGRYVNAVESEEELYIWLMNNLPPKNGGEDLSPSITLEECVTMATDKNYTFIYDNRWERILDSVRIEKVAREFVKLTKRGENYTFDCPFCGEASSAYISPKHQIFKCFKCGETGNVLTFVKKMKRCSFAQAMDWLEKTYITK